MGNDYDEATTMVLIDLLPVLFKCHLNIEIENASAYTPAKIDGHKQTFLIRKGNRRGNVSVWFPLVLFFPFFRGESSLKKTKKASMLHVARLALNLV